MAAAVLAMAATLLAMAGPGPGTGPDSAAAQTGPDTAGGEGPGLIFVDGRSFDSLSAAFQAAGDGSRILISEGTYREGAVLTASNVRISGAGMPVIQGTAVRGKGALVIRGSNVTIANIECHSIAVADENGVCVRFEGRNLVLDNVHFHHSEGGVMTNPGAGTVEIRRSRFAHLGYQSFHHGIYFTGHDGELIIRDSRFLATHNEGHEIKSRARRTVIENTVIASLDSADSRLVDIPDGGTLILRNSVLQEGTRSTNWDLIGFAVESNRHPSHSIVLDGNLLISDIARPTVALGRGADIDITMELSGNIAIGEFRRGLGGDTVTFPSRAAAGLPPAPALPHPPDIAGWLERARSAAGTE